MQNSRTVTRNKQKNRPFPGKLSMVTAAVRGVLMGSLVSLSIPQAYAELPQAAQTWVTYGNASYVENGTTMDITQTTDRTILNWDSFNIGEDNTVRYSRPGGTAFTSLNRIAQRDPSRIMGNLISGNGRIYLINQNGFIFGDNANVHVHSFIASTLDIDDQLFEDGQLFHAIELGEADFTREFLGDEMGDVTLLAGARIKTASGGRVMLIAPEIINEGFIATPDGQALLIATDFPDDPNEGDSRIAKVYLKANDNDPSLRGLLVEVDTGGEVTNLGEIVAERGNITMLGMAVNQNGTLRATTSVKANGTIRLLARDKASVNELPRFLERDDFIGEEGIEWILGVDALPSGESENNPVPVATRTGTVTFGEGSVTEILPDSSDDTLAVDEQEQLLSKVEVMGSMVHLENDARVTVVGGDVTLAATQSPDNPFQITDEENPSSIIVDEGAIIDVSGTDTAQIAMERNVVAVEWRSDETADSPLQRESEMRGSTVFVDSRVGTALLNVEKTIAQKIQRGIIERLSSGGSVKIASEGGVIVRDGAAVDVSGGAVNYQGGFIATTKLTSEGEVYDISEADPNRRYDGLAGRYIRTSDKWGEDATEIWESGTGRFESAYVDGKDAGSLEIYARNVILDGDLIADLVAGRYQREEEESPEGAKLIIGDSVMASNSRQTSYRPPAVTFISANPFAGIDPTAPMDQVIDRLVTLGRGNELYALSGADELVEIHQMASFENDDGAIQYATLEEFRLQNLPTLINSDRVFNNVAQQTVINSGGIISVPEEVNLRLPSGSHLSLDGLEIDLQGGINTPSGYVSLTTQFLSQNALEDTVQNPNFRPEHNGRITLGSESYIKTAGTWTNDHPLLNSGEPLGTVRHNGGSVSIEANGDLLFMEGSTIDVGGGGWIQNNGEFVAGRGGDIALSSEREQGARLTLDGELRGYATGDGGKLSVAAHAVCIGGAACNIDAINAPLILDTAFFQSGGFAEYEIEANLGGTALDSQGASLTDESREEVILGMRVASDARLHAQRAQRVLENGFLTRTTGSNIEEFSHVEMLPEVEREAVELTLSLSQKAADSNVVDARFYVEDGAAISVDAGGDISLRSDSSLEVDGTIRAQGGSIDLNITPPGGKDPNFVADQAIILGEGAYLDASGVSQLVPNDLGLRQGDLLAGGTVSLRADRGYIIIEDGSTIDVSGASDTLHLPSGLTGGMTQYVETEISSDAGGIDLVAAEGIALNGALIAHGDSAIGGRGGSLHVEMNASSREVDREVNRSLPVDQRFPSEPLTIRVSNSPSTSIVNGEAYFSISTLENSGIESLTLRTNQQPLGGQGNGVIHFDDDVSLELAQRIQLESANITTDGGIVNLDAPYIALGSTRQGQQGMNESSSGSGAFNVNGNLVDLIGNVQFSGFTATRITSQNDIRLRGVQASNTERELKGEFRTTGELILQADQVYPTTLSEYSLVSEDRAEGSGDGSITILPGIGMATAVQGNRPVLSAAGRVIVDASNIEQLGVLKAPLGEIILGRGAETQSIILGEGSITSVSADGQIIPFGIVDFDGLDWSYIVGNQTRVFSAAADDLFDPLQEKLIWLEAETVEVKEGATVDLRGNGDLYGYEWIPGIDGTYDTLAVENNPGSYAVLPGLGSEYAPYDPMYYQGSELRPGDSIYISEGSDLPEGVYPLLPARYALLPGAYLVTLEENSQDILPGTTLNRIDSTPVVAGKRVIAGTAVDNARWSGFAVEPGDIVRTRSGYKDYYSNEFFSQQAEDLGIEAPLLAQDAGRMVIDVATSLKLQGEFLTSLAGAGRGGSLDIAADNIDIVNDYSAGGEGRIELLASELNELNIESLLIGGIRSHESQGVYVDSRTDSLVVREDVTLQRPELLLAAREELVVESGAEVQGRGEHSGRVDDILIGRNPEYEQGDDESEVLVREGINGDGALLRVSAADQVSIIRSNSGRDERGEPLAEGASGILDVREGAVVGSSGSVVIDAALEPIFSGELDLDGGALNLGASRISLGETEGREIDGLILSNQDLMELPVSELKLTSRSTIDLYSNVRLGERDDGDVLLERLDLETSGIVGHGAVGESLITANSISITGSSAQTTDVNATGEAGSLRIEAYTADTDDAGNQDGNVMLGEGSYTIAGFSDVILRAENEIIGDGNAKLLIDASTVLEASRISGTAASELSISAGGHELAITTPEVISSLPDVTALNSRIDIDASAIRVNGRIVTPSGRISLRATGVTDSDNVTLASGAILDVSGRRQLFSDLVIDSDGGRMVLASDNGDVIVADGASLDLSGSRDDRADRFGDTGSIELSAVNGNLSLDGTLNATSAGGRQGSVSIDIASLDDFSSLNRKLQESGLTESLELRLRQGDLTIAQDDTVSAHEIGLSADDGSITIDGWVIANGSDGGDINISANNDITLNGSAGIMALTGDPEGKGGEIELTSIAGDLMLNPGSLIATNEDESGSRIRLIVDRERVENALLESIIFSDRVELVGMETYQETDGVITAADRARYHSESQSFINEVSPDLFSQSMTEGEQFQLMPGVKVRRDGDLVVDGNWDLSTWRYNGTPGLLTLESSGDIYINGSISDGFSSGVVPIDSGGFGFDIPVEGMLREDDSWNYRIISGRDFNSAATMVVSNVNADITLSSGNIVRTGTGAIEIAASGNLNLQDSSSTIYTAGRNAGTGGYDRAALMFSLIPDAYYGVDGGDLDITVDGDINGAISNQLPTDWLHRVGGNSAANDVPGTWAVVYKDFQQGAGALGGGDVAVKAGGDINDFSVSVPTTGQQQGEVLFDFSTNQYVIDDNASYSIDLLGGGDMNIIAGGDINGGNYYLGRGNGLIKAGGNFASHENASIKPILLVGDARFDVRAGKGISLGGVVNPTVLTQSALQSEATWNIDGRNLESYFYTYTGNSGVSLTSLSGDIYLENDSGKINDFRSVLFSSAVQGNKNSLLPGTNVYPATFYAQALGGDLQLGGSFTLYPSETGDLRLLADGNIVNVSTAPVTISLSDADASLLPDMNSPAALLADANSRLITTGTVLNHASVPVHINDENTAYIVAKKGDITTKSEKFTIDLAKAAIIQAGSDVRDVGINIQNLRDSDVSQILAGRDFIYTIQRRKSGINKGAVAGGGAGTTVSGPGRVDVIAGRDVNLGTSFGISTNGDRENAVLSDSGADIFIFAGVDPDANYSAFIEKYISEDSLVESADQYRQHAIDFMRTRNGDPDMNASQALIEFSELKPVDQRRIVSDALFNELREAGVAAIASGNSADYQSGYDAIDTLFPEETDRKGDLKMFFSKLHTLDDGTINMIVPGGLINVGLAATKNFNRDISELGIVTLGDGDINGVTDGDILVNESRVMALDGGSMLLWSGNSNIDAGRGAKTAIAITETEGEFINGEYVPITPPSVSGSGIRAGVTTPGKEPGRISLFAPRGMIDAGDAGIDASGDLEIGAPIIGNADNIDASGNASGVPVADTSGLAGSITGLGDLSSTRSIEESAAESADSGSATPIADEALTYLEVEVLSYGERYDEEE